MSDRSDSSTHMGSSRPFFSGQTTSAPVRAYVAAGNGSDALFQAAAMAVVDAVYSPFSLSNDVLSLILRAYSQCYPELISNGLDTPASRLKAIFAQQPMSQTVADLAMVLRQMTVNEFCRNPAYYRLAFVNSSGITAPERMRQSGTPLGGVGLSALAKALGLPIRVSVCQEEKELPAMTESNSEAAGPKKPVLMIRVSEAKALAKVYPTRFNGYQEVAATPLNPGARFPSISMSEIHALIAAADQQLVSLYFSTLKYLLAAYVAGELAYEALQAVYLSSPSHSEAAPLTGLETGSHDFFKRILASATLGSTGLPEDSQGVLGLNTLSLCQAVARSVSLGQIAEQKLDEVIVPSQRQGMTSRA